MPPLWFGLLTKPRPPNSISPWVHQYGTGAGGGALTGSVTMLAGGGGGLGGHCAEVAFPSVQALAPVASPPSQHPCCANALSANSAEAFSTAPSKQALTNPARCNMAPEP